MFRFIVTFVVFYDTQTTDINECFIDNGGCSYTCTNTPGSYTCDCSTGYTYDPIEMNCSGKYDLKWMLFWVNIDTDECAVANGGCEDICTNTNGSFYCSCGTGFQLNNNVFCSGKEVLSIKL